MSIRKIQSFLWITLFLLIKSSWFRNSITHLTILYIQRVFVHSVIIVKYGLQCLKRMCTILLKKSKKIFYTMRQLSWINPKYDIRQNLFDCLQKQLFKSGPCSGSYFFYFLFFMYRNLNNFCDQIYYQGKGQNRFN